MPTTRETELEQLILNNASTPFLAEQAKELLKDEWCSAILVACQELELNSGSGHIQSILRSSGLEKDRMIRVQKEQNFLNKPMLKHIKEAYK